MIKTFHINRTHWLTPHIIKNLELKFQRLLAIFLCKREYDLVHDKIQTLLIYLIIWSTRVWAYFSVHNVLLGFGIFLF
jgi:hypothetical protein